MTRVKVEFTTDWNREPQVHDVLGRPVLTGGVQPVQESLSQLSIDGIKIDFDDGYFATNLHQAIVKGKKLEAQGFDFDEFTLVALLDGIDCTRLVGADKKLEVVFDQLEALNARTYESSNTDTVLGLGSRNGEFKTRTLVRRVGILTERFAELEVITKLGKSGPIYFSTIEDAMAINQTYSVVPVRSLTVS